MTRKAAATLILGTMTLLLLTGCQFGGIDLGPWGDPWGVNPPQPNEEIVRLVSPAGAIQPPLANNRSLWYDAAFTPGDLYLLDFNPGRDEYGNRTGFSDERYVLQSVTIQCEQEPLQDQLFLHDPAHRDRAPTTPNTAIWFPRWARLMCPFENRPIPYKPLQGHPWSACREAIQGAPEQSATIVATAKATWIEVEFVLPDQGGHYVLEGYTATESSTIRHRISRSGEYIVTHSGGTEYVFDVPESWFWIRGEWRVTVGGTADC